MIRRMMMSSLKNNLAPVLSPIPGWQTDGVNITNVNDFAPSMMEGNAWTDYYIPSGGTGIIRGRSEYAVFGLAAESGEIGYASIDFGVWTNGDKPSTYNDNVSSETGPVAGTIIVQIRLDGSLVHFEYSNDGEATWNPIISPLTQLNIPYYPKITFYDTSERVYDLVGSGYTI
ncbi:hypothetical protein [Pedobacter africanus]|uniref:Uncharacterized protein n=1 Tax=Pedobacter africanus TaxID=151894 RepID=A0A1W1ZB57_9SPHI|nr:hypothetical protein [Pedobacter africanus]SMC45664.1 hypothetical protein SAMN04488524_0557 [Pedobacter africanus]